MSKPPAAAGPARWAGSLVSRVLHAWRVFPPERRLAAMAAAGLFVTLFLPWYQETLVVATGSNRPPTASASLTGWGAFSFVEAAVLLVAVAVLVLLIQRAEGRAFHLPGGDGNVVMAAGIWTCVLVVWRIFDKQSTDIHGQGVSISGVEWGILVALAVAALLAYSGSRIRASHLPEPPLPGEETEVPRGAPADFAASSWHGNPRPRYDERARPGPRRARDPGESDEQLTIPLEHED